MLLELIGDESYLPDDTLKFSNLVHIHKFPLNYKSCNDPPYTKDISKRLESIESISLEKIRNEIKNLKLSDNS